eukprot:4410411-Amphidinium_carterae.1
MAHIEWEGSSCRAQSFMTRTNCQYPTNGSIGNQRLVGRLPKCFLAVGTKKFTTSFALPSAMDFQENDPIAS